MMHPSKLKHIKVLPLASPAHPLLKTTALAENVRNKNGQPLSNAIYRKLAELKEKHYDRISSEVLTALEHTTQRSMIVSRYAPSILRRLAKELNSYGFHAKIFECEQAPYIRLRVEL